MKSKEHLMLTAGMGDNSLLYEAMSLYIPDHVLEDGTLPDAELIPATFHLSDVSTVRRIPLGSVLAPVALPDYCRAHVTLVTLDSGEQFMLLVDYHEFLNTWRHPVLSSINLTVN